METERYAQELQIINSKPDRREAIKLIRLEEDLLIKRHKTFTSGLSDAIDLASFDLRPQIGFGSNGPVQAIFSENERVGVNYEDIYARFLKHFSKDIMDVSIGVNRKMPEPKTKRLKDFILKNPFSDVGYNYFAYSLKPDALDLRFLIIERYFEDLRFTNALAEVWTETRL